jgi:TPR repeat protein
MFSFTHYQKSAELNNHEIYRVGQCYLHGIGVEKDELRAFTWYEKSANAGNSGGMYQVGVCYLQKLLKKMYSKYLLSMRNQRTQEILT